MTSGFFHATKPLLNPFSKMNKSLAKLDSGDKDACQDSTVMKEDNLPDIDFNGPDVEND